MPPEKDPILDVTAGESFRRARSRVWYDRSFTTSTSLLRSKINLFESRCLPRQRVCSFRRDDSFGRSKGKGRLTRPEIGFADISVVAGWSDSFFLLFTETNVVEENRISLYFLSETIFTTGIGVALIFSLRRRVSFDIETAEAVIFFLLRKRRLQTHRIPITGCTACHGQPTRRWSYAQKWIENVE